MSSCYECTSACVHTTLLLLLSKPATKLWIDPPSLSRPPDSWRTRRPTLPYAACVTYILCYSTLLASLQLEDSPTHFATTLKAGGIMDVVEKVGPC